MKPHLTDYPRVALRIPPSDHGIAQVIHQEMPEDHARMVAARMRMPVDDGVSTALQIAGNCFMSDLEYERKTCLDLAHHARGRVLIAGLGLGMVLPPILEDDDVEQVTVLEKVADVITLIAPHYDDPKLQVVHADVLTWRPADGEEFDVIYFDIWPLITPMNLVQMTFLHRAFAPFLAAGGWMESWMRRELLRRVRFASRQDDDPYAGEMAGCGNASQESPETARQLIGILRRLSKVPLQHAAFVATTPGTHRSCGTDGLPEVSS